MRYRLRNRHGRAGREPIPCPKRSARRAIAPERERLSFDLGLWTLDFGLLTLDSARASHTVPQWCRSCRPIAWADAGQKDWGMYCDWRTIVEACDGRFRHHVTWRRGQCARRTTTRARHCPEQSRAHRARLWPRLPGQEWFRCRSELPDTRQTDARYDDDDHWAYLTPDCG